MSLDATRENIFQNDMIQHMQANGWVLGAAKYYDRENALYSADVLSFVQNTQAEEWKKFCQNYPIDSERHFIDALVVQLKKADINATDQASRSYGTLGVLRHGLKIRNARFKLCQFKNVITSLSWLNPNSFLSRWLSSLILSREEGR